MLRHVSGATFMRIGLIGHLKFPIRRPYAGGLEMFTHGFVTGLRRRGHDVTLFASADSDRILPLEPIVPAGTVDAFAHRPEKTRDSEIESHEDRAYGDLMGRLDGRGFDVLHNNSLSPVVLRLGVGLRTPMVTTLHVPPLPRLTQLLRQFPAVRDLSYINVSQANADAWQEYLPSHPVVHNGTDTQLWCPSAAGRRLAVGGEPRAIWSGRILADKGTSLAVDAAHRAGLAIDVVGPINDPAYFEQEVRPLLTARDCYHGLLDHTQLSQLVARASVALVTPCWDEPFGLVVSEALSSGTPVAAFERGGPAELIDPTVGRLAKAGDVKDLARAITECLSVERRACRQKAVQDYSITAMIRRYELMFEQQLNTVRSTRVLHPLPGKPSERAGRRAPAASKAAPLTAVPVAAALPDVRLTNTAASP